MVSTFVQRRARLLAVVALTLVSAVLIIRASRVVDGQRYFWLDDDQMVSMRYARNLVDGHGFVWNPGERVEGYTSLGWTLVMAAMHVLPLGDATTSLAVKIVAWLLACWVLVLTDRLLTAFVPHPGAARPAVLVALALCADLVFWSANGFETTLLTAVFLLALLRVLDDAERSSPRVATFLAIGLLPIARSDAYPLWAALGVLAVVLQRSRRLLTRRVWAAAVFPAMQMAFRLAYYGEWLPNTYYLKVAGIHGLWWSGVNHLKAFAETYSVAIVLVLAAMGWARDRRVRWLILAAAFSVWYVLMVGSDMFPHYRFLAPWVPVLLVLGAAACWELAALAPRPRTVLLFLMAASTVIQAGVHGRASLAELVSGNGVPEHGLVAGVMIGRFTRPDATLAVTAAGNVPYFSRRRAIDLLGKTDAHVARLPAHDGAPIGHKKFDIEYSLSRQPDLLVTFWPYDFGSDSVSRAYARSADGRSDYRVALLLDASFNRDYQEHAVPLDYLLTRGAIYVRGSSPEIAAINGWRLPAVEP